MTPRWRAPCCSVPSCVLGRFPLLSPPPGLRTDAARAGAKREASRSRSWSRRDAETWRPDPAFATSAAAATAVSPVPSLPPARPLVSWKQISWPPETGGLGDPLGPQLLVRAVRGLPPFPSPGQRRELRGSATKEAEKGPFLLVGDGTTLEGLCLRSPHLQGTVALGDDG